MKKILSILSAFLGVGFLICFIAGMCSSVPVGVPSKASFVYKLCNGIEYFLTFLPAMIISGMLISSSVHFGHNSEHSTLRFSHAMAKRYEGIVITSLICTLFLSLANETFGILVSKKKENIINRPKIITEYINVGNSLYNNGLYERSLMYADAVLKLDPNSSAARDLKSRSNMELNREQLTDLRFNLEKLEPLKIEDDSIKIDSVQLANTYEYLLKSSEAFAKEQWFDAHYFAETGIKIATAKDPNLSKLKDLSAEAWNNLTEQHVQYHSEAEQIFEQKYKGYIALMQEDDLQAYYIFRYLNENYPILKNDRDVQFYFDVAKNRIEQKYFFIDETLELETFENVNDVYFSYKRIDGTTDIIYFKGMTLLKSSGQTIQYLRDFSIVTLKNGEWIRTMHVPYAKIMPVSVKNLNDATKTMLEITDETDYVPYILLKSIGRDDMSQVSVPQYIYANGESASTPEYMIYPLAYEDFLMLENSNLNTDQLSLTTLYELAKNGSSFGYSQQVFGHILLNRLLYPLMVLILLILTACFGWNYRIGETSYFRMSWIFSFPIIIELCYLFYKAAIFLFRLLNYIIVNLCSPGLTLVVGISVYILLFILASILFLSRKSS